MSDTGRRQFLNSVLASTAWLTAMRRPSQTSTQPATQPRLGARRLGPLEVSALGLGCMGMTGVYGAPKDRDEMIRLIRAAVERGVTLFDSAEAYGPYTNETLVGEALAPFRQQVTIITKFGFKLDPNGGADILGVDSRPAHIREVAEASLKRLRVEALDLFFQHRVDPAVPIEDVAGTIRDLVREGKVKHYGLCEVGAEVIRRAHAVHPIAAIQSEYSLSSRTVEANVLPTCEALGIGFIAYSPLGRGFLTGRFTAETTFEGADMRRGMARFSPDSLRANQGFVELLSGIAARHRATPPQVALAWLLSRKPFIVPIPGTTQVRHLEDNIGSAALALSPQDLREIETAAAAITAKG